MKTKLMLFLIAGCVGGVEADTTIDSSNRFAYSGNLAWIDGRADGSNGVVVGEFVCSGYLYSANAGWINLGGGAPADGVRYQNNSPIDFGVNHDGLGNLSGYAYGANIGWLTFTNRDQTGGAFDGPRVDLVSGKLSGFIWSATCGWISLSNGQAFVRTGSIRPGKDSDNDGIPDAWELFHFGNLSTAGSNSDFDHDGFTDRQEYLADTDPESSESNLRITGYAFGAAGTAITLSWSSRLTRQYRILGCTGFDGSSVWGDFGLGLISPQPGETTTQIFTEPSSGWRFFEIQALRPLFP